MYNGGNLKAKVPFSWKNTFSLGVLIPQKLRNCSKCSKNILCDDLIN